MQMRISLSAHVLLAVVDLSLRGEGSEAGRGEDREGDRGKWDGVK